ncbi:hypothetical protein AAHE18_17G010300 [Arachis hypogaea]
MQEPRYPLPRVVLNSCGHSSPRPDAVSGAGRGEQKRLASLALSAPGFCSCLRRGAGRARPALPRLGCLWTRSRVNPGLCGIDNDPSAGSPTETLLRLLLPLNDKVQWTSHNVAGSEPPTSPRSEHFTGPFNR